MLGLDLNRGWSGEPRRPGTSARRLRFVQAPALLPGERPGRGPCPFTLPTASAAQATLGLEKTTPWRLPMPMAWHCAFK
jgi:hypothetical protein